MVANVTPDYSVSLNGPIFTGAVYGQMKAALRDIEDDVGEELIETIRSIDDATFKNPTGYATSRVTKHRKGTAMTVDRGGLAYGPWLEDGGSRADIFPGYHAFEKATRTVDAKVPDIAARIVDRHLIR